MADLLEAAILIKAPTKIDAVELDCSVTENHVHEVEVTEHPVEEGSNVTDHARPKPNVITIDGLVSDTPLNRTQHRRTINAFGITFESATEADHIRGKPGYAAQAYVKLKDLYDNPRMITLQTELATYEDMLLTSLVVPRNKDIGDALRFTATFKRIRIVRNKLTVAKKSTNKLGAKKVATGKQAGKTADDPTKEKSIAYKIAESTGLLEKLGIKKP